MPINALVRVATGRSQLVAEGGFQPGDTGRVFVELDDNLEPVDVYARVTAPNEPWLPNTVGTFDVGADADPNSNGVLVRSDGAPLVFMLESIQGLYTLVHIAAAR